MYRFGLKPNSNLVLHVCAQSSSPQTQHGYEGAFDGSSSRGSTLSHQSSVVQDKHNPFQFFDRIDQEIEENKQRLKETTSTTTTTTSTVPIMRATEGLGFGHLDAAYEHSEAKKGGYNAFFNINFDQFGTSNLSSPPVTTATTNKSNHNAFSGENKNKKKAGGECGV